MSVDPNALAENVAHVRERIARATQRSGRRAEEVTLVAVSKTFPPDAIRAAYGAGVRHFGENRLQEFEAKLAKLRDLEITWHMVGHVQSNKARKVAELFDRVDTIDRLSIAEKLDAAISEGAPDRKLPVLIEVKLSGEDSKSGVEEGALIQLAHDVTRNCTGLELQGLMVIPPYAEDPERARPYFRHLRELREAVRQRLGLVLPVLSMGMSHDFEVAIEEGATEVRVGTAIFGERQKAK